MAPICGPTIGTQNQYVFDLKNQKKKLEKFVKLCIYDKATNCTFFKGQNSTCSHNLNFGAKTN